MQLYTSEQMGDLFATAKTRAAHLETRDEYKSASEDAAMRRFLDTGADPGGEWFTSWAQRVQGMTGRGVTVQRARIVTVPVTRYTSYLLALTPHNIAAGEDVRWVPRDQARPQDAAADDFWLLDDHTVAYSVFTADDDWWSGCAATTDPVIVGYACMLWDRVWGNATEHEQFRP